MKARLTDRCIFLSRKKAFAWLTYRGYWKNRKGRYGSLRKNMSPAPLKDDILIRVDAADAELWEAFK